MVKSAAISQVDGDDDFGDSEVVKQLQCNPDALYLASDSAAFPAVYNYYTEHDLAAVIAPGYFDPARSNLRPFDMITAISNVDKRMKDPTNCTIATLITFEVPSAKHLPVVMGLVNRFKPTKVDSRTHDDG